MDENITAEDIKKRIKEKLSKSGGTTDIDRIKLQNNPKKNAAINVTEANKEINASDLLNYHGEKFIKEIYEKVLFRKPDHLGFSHYRNLLLDDVPKEIILYSIATSPEAQGKNVSIIGLELLKKAIWKYRLIKGFKKIPIISNLVFWLYRLVRLSRDYRELQLNINNRLDIINRTEDELYNELAKINFEIADREKAINDSLTQTRNDLNESLVQTRSDLSDSITQTRNDLNEKGRTVDDVSNRLNILSRTEDALYNELAKINSEIAEKNKHMDIKLNDILSGEFSSLKKTLKEHYNLIQDLQRILNTTSDASGFTKKKGKE